MIRVLNNSDIDRELWDKRIMMENYPKPYSFSWFLDHMSPGWSALASDDYKTIIPLTKRKKYFIEYLATPAFLQQVNLLGCPDMSKEELFIRDLLTDRFRYFDFQVSKKIEDDRISIHERQNLIIELNKSYDHIYSNYRRDCRKNIRNALDGENDITKDCQAEDLIELFKQNTGKKLPGITSNDFKGLNSLINYALENKLGEIYCIRFKGKIIYGAFIINTGGRITLLFTPTTPLSHARMCGYLFTDFIIQQYAGKEYVLDFSGSSIPSIAGYMKSFGCTAESYYSLYYNNLPWPLKSLKKKTWLLTIIVL